MDSDAENQRVKSVFSGSFCVESSLSLSSSLIPDFSRSPRSPALPRVCETSSGNEVFTLQTDPPDTLFSPPNRPCDHLRVWAPVLDDKSNANPTQTEDSERLQDDSLAQFSHTVQEFASSGRRRGSAQLGFSLPAAAVTPQLTLTHQRLGL